MKTVILAAGFGSRLWPLSTSEKPKQFQPLLHGQSLLAYTYGQMLKITPVDELYVLVLAGMEPLVHQELPSIADNHIIVVPERRNTMPHTLWALSQITTDPSEPVLFKSVDHYITNPDDFAASIKYRLDSYQTTDKSDLTMLCTAYKAYNSNDGYCAVGASGELIEFLEKRPESEVERSAAKHTIYRSPMIYIATRKACLTILNNIKEGWSTDAKLTLNEDGRLRTEAFLRMPFMDIRHLFEPSSTIRVNEIQYGFIDVGRFDELYALNDKDEYDNVCIGNVVIGRGCSHILAINERSEPLVVIGVSDSVVVQTLAGSLVAPFKDAAQVGEIYKQRIYAAR
jgi:mannose-1-phosphate guanylyltransferase